MSRKEIGTQWDRDNRNAINENFKNLFHEFTNVVEVVSEKAYGDVIDAAKLNWQEPVSSQSNLPSEAEEGDTRFVRDTGKVFRFNGEEWNEIQQIDATPINEVERRFNDNLNSVNQQLAQTTDESRDRSESNYQIYKSGTAMIRTRKPTFTIQDDDVRTELYTKLYPIAVEYNIPISAGLISGRMGDHHPNTITMAQFYEMRDSGLVEFCNHTHSHQHLTQMTVEEAVEDVRKCEEWLEAHGCAKAKHLIYPFGDYSNDMWAGISKYVHSATRSNNHIINPDGGTISTFSLNRVVFEADTSLIKQRIDDAVATNGWLILNTHAGFDTFSESKMREIIDYALEQGMEFDNFSNPYQNFSNILQVYDIGGEGLLGTISASGVRRGIFDNSVDLPIENRDPTNVLADSRPSIFKEYTITITNFTNVMGLNNGFPSGGNLYTDRRGANDQYTHQIFLPMESNQVLKRYWNFRNDIWSEWVDINKKEGNYVEFTSPAYTLPAFGRQAIPIYNDDFEVGDSIIINPISNYPTFFMYTVYISQQGQAYIRLFNFSDTEREMPETNWIVRWFKNN